MTDDDWFDQLLRQAIERDKAEKRREREEIRREESESVIRETERQRDLALSTPENRYALEQYEDWRTR